MNSLNNKKQLAAIKDSLDALEEKYRLDESNFSQHLLNQKDEPENIHQKGSFRNVINEYIQKLTLKKRLKKEK